MASTDAAWDVCHVSAQICVQCQYHECPEDQALQLTEQANLEPNLRQRLHILLRLSRRNMATVTPEHVQSIDPIRPARRIRCNLVRNGRTARGEERERERRDR